MTLPSLLVLLSAALLATRAEASQGAIYWVPSLPTAGTKDHTPDFTLRGMGAEAMYRVRPQIDLGISFRIVYFRNEQENQTYTPSSSTAITGRLFRSTESFPVLFHGRYLFPEDGGFSPFVGLGIGPAYVQKDLSIGTFVYNAFGWQFMLAPELGFSYAPPASRYGAYFNLRYDAGFGTDAVSAVSYLSFALGIQSRL